MIYIDDRNQIDYGNMHQIGVNDNIYRTAVTPGSTIETEEIKDHESAQIEKKTVNNLCWWVWIRWTDKKDNILFSPN